MFFLHSTDTPAGATIGAKALRLMELRQAGYQVPDFVVLPNETVEQIIDGTCDIKTLCADIATVLPSKRYAVRSAAINEDSTVSSMAGQFLTKIDVSEVDMAAAVMAVVQDAKNKYGQKFTFSIIIQTFIESQMAGVFFTRDPQGGREMIIEYRSGRGDAVVGGAKVQHLRLLPNEASLHRRELVCTEELVKIGQELEERYSWPQDIEWAVLDGVVHVLQTRPITSISVSQWEGFKYIERVLKDNENYIFAKTAVSETFHCPRTLAFSMLIRLYAEGGPIEKTYKKLGVSYQEQEQFRLFGNDLFVNREAEIQTLYPSYGYTKNRSAIPRQQTWSGWKQTFLNQLALARISVSGEELFRKQVLTLLIKPLPTGSVEECFDFFLNNYPLLFEINIKTEKALQQYTTLTKKTLQSSVYHGLLFAPEKMAALCKEADLVLGAPIGNSISIDDRSPFMSYTSAEASSKTEEVKPVQIIQQLALEKITRIASSYISLRELARLAGIRMMAEVRKSVDELAKKHSLETSDLLYFATYEEIVSQTFSIEVLVERKTNYENNKSLQFPLQIASFSRNQKQGVVGVSPGKAEGILLTKEDISSKSKSILLTDMLTPDLVTCFPNIAGIIARQGGQLSHLAIMAREAGLPVVVTEESLKIGSKIFLDGTNGVISVTKDAL